METGTFPKSHWGDIEPLIGRGVLKDISDELPPIIPTEYRKFRYLLKDEKDNRFYCTLWEPPIGEPWLQIRLYQDDELQKKEDEVEKGNQSNKS